MGRTENRMQESVRHLAEQLRSIRPGRLSAGFLTTVRVTIQGNPVAIGKLARIASQGDRLLVTPFDSAHSAAVVRGLVEAKLSAYALDPQTVCVSQPPVSVEQRRDVVKHVKKLGEEAKVSIRSIRQDVRKDLTARGKGKPKFVQEATDAAIAEVERLVNEKVAELES